MIIPSCIVPLANQPYTIVQRTGGCYFVVNAYVGKMDYWRSSATAQEPQKCE